MQQSKSNSNNQQDSNQSVHENPIEGKPAEGVPEHRQDLSSKKRYKYCCRKCKHSERGKKSCVCVVPLSQRRASIGQTGCQTCSCKGCSIQDFIHRGEDPQYHPRENTNQPDRRNYQQENNLRNRQTDPRHPHNQSNQRSREKQFKFDAINGCCRLCMKAFAKNKKSCLCQVPKKVRKGHLPSNGCKICGCDGCNPRDFKSRSKSSSSRGSYSYSRSSSPNSSSDSGRSYNEREYNFNNMDRSQFGKVIIVEYNLNPGMLGLGIPQRTPSYILGRPQ